MTKSDITYIHKVSKRVGKVGSNTILTTIKSQIILKSACQVDFLYIITPES